MASGNVASWAEASGKGNIGSSTSTNGAGATSRSENITLSVAARPLSVEGDDGRRHWWSISGVPRNDAAGRLRGYHGVGRDITARIQQARTDRRRTKPVTRIGIDAVALIAGVVVKAF